MEEVRLLKEDFRRSLAEFSNAFNEWGYKLEKQLDVKLADKLNEIKESEDRLIEMEEINMKLHERKELKIKEKRKEKLLYEYERENLNFMEEKKIESIKLQERVLHEISEREKHGYSQMVSRELQKKIKDYKKYIGKEKALQQLEIQIKDCDKILNLYKTTMGLEIKLLPEFLKYISASDSFLEFRITFPTNKSKTQLDSFNFTLKENKSDFGHNFYSVVSAPILRNFDELIYELNKHQRIDIFIKNLRYSLIKSFSLPTN